MTLRWNQTMYGLDDEDMAMIRAVLSKYPVAESAILYGSRATGRNRPGSDVDLMLVGKPLPHRTLLDIMNDFDDSDLPYYVDIVTANDINAEIKQEIDKTGQLLYNA